MKQSQLFTKTRKEAPKGEEAKNAQLLIRAGYVHKVAAGVYTLLPLGVRVLDNIATIIRDEMNAIGGQETQSTVLQAKEPWEASGRWDDQVVDNWFKTSLKGGGELSLAFTHEEPMTVMMKNFIASYKDLPAYPYDVRTVFRNEARAKSGLMRGREFYWKALYSFSKDEDQHAEFYDKISDAYQRVFERVGLGDITFKTFASGGTFSKYSHEFQTLCDAGEDIIFITKDRIYNREIAPSAIPEDNKREEPKKREDKKRLGIIGVDDLVNELGVPVEKTTKTLIYNADGEIVVAAVRGDYQINELKLQALLSCKNLSLATEKQVQDLTGSEIGYAGIINIPKGTSVFIDDSIKGLCNFETGTNKTGYHSLNVNFGIDLDHPEKFHDIKLAKEGDKDPESGEIYKISKAVEVGNIFTLGEKFSEPLELTFTDEEGKPQNVFMGSYGIGISRLLGVIAEVLSDDRGLVWPEEIAPFTVHLLTFGKNENIFREAESLYHDLKNAGIDVLFDDRDVSPGLKLGDADLIGIPYRVVVSEKAAEKGGVEITKRATGEVEFVDPSRLVAHLTEG